MKPLSEKKGGRLSRVKDFLSKHKTQSDRTLSKETVEFISLQSYLFETISSAQDAESKFKDRGNSKGAELVGSWVDVMVEISVHLGKCSGIYSDMEFRLKDLHNDLGREIQKLTNASNVIGRLETEMKSLEKQNLNMKKIIQKQIDNGKLLS